MRWTKTDGRDGTAVWALDGLPLPFGYLLTRRENAQTGCQALLRDTGERFTVLTLARQTDEGLRSGVVADWATLGDEQLDLGHAALRVGIDLREAANGADELAVRLAKEARAKCPS